MQTHAPSRLSPSRVRLLCCAVAGLGFMLAWLTFRPGFMSYDSLVQYEMSRTLEFIDWHPPIMSALWAALGSHWVGPGGMLAFQLALLWVGVLGGVAHFQWRPAAAWLLILPFLPWVANFQGVLWKDVGMAYALLLLSALLLAPPSRWRWPVAALLIFYALNLRHNAIVAVAPLVFMMFRVQPRPVSAIRAGMYSAGVLAACLLAGQWFSYGVLKAEKTAATGYMMLDDLAHLSLHADRSLIPGKPLLDIQRCAATDVGSNRLVGRAMCLYEPETVLQELADMPELRAVWLEQVAAHPWAYLRFRIATFGYLLRSPASEPYFIWQPGIDANDLGLAAPPNGLSRSLERYVFAASHAVPLLFKPYGWLTLCSLGLLLGYALRRTPVQRCAQALFASGWLYIAGYAFTTPMADFRYVYWSALACSLAVTLLLIDRPGRRSNKRMWKPASLLAAGIICVTLIPLWERLTAADTDTMLREALAKTGQLTALHVENRHDLSPDTGWLNITGPDPYIVFLPTDPVHSGQRAQFLYFTLACRNSNAAPLMQIFAWGGAVAGPTEQHSQVFAARQGLNMVALAPQVLAVEPLTAIRIDIDQTNGCTSLELNGVTLILS